MLPKLLENKEILKIKWHSINVHHFEYKNCETKFDIILTELNEKEIPAIFTDLWVRKVINLVSFHKLQSIFRMLFYDDKESKNIILRAFCVPWFYSKYIHNENLNLEFYSKFIAFHLLWGVMGHLGFLKYYLNILSNQKDKKNTNRLFLEIAHIILRKYPNISKASLEQASNAVHNAINAVIENLGDIHYSLNGKYYLQGMCIRESLKITENMVIRKPYTGDFKFTFIELTSPKKNIRTLTNKLQSILFNWEKIRNIYIHKPTAIIEYRKDYSPKVQDLFSNLFITLTYLPFFKLGSIRLVNFIEKISVNNNMMYIENPFTLSVNELIDRTSNNSLCKKNILFKTKFTENDAENFRIFIGKLRMLLNIFPNKMEIIDNIYSSQNKNIDTDIKLNEAIARYYKAIYDSENYQETVFYAISGLETLYNSSEEKIPKEELAYRASTLLACFIKNRKEIASTIYEGYRVYRNAFAHGKNVLLRRYLKINPEINFFGKKEINSGPSIVGRSLIEILLERESARLKEITPKILKLKEITAKIVNYLRLSILVFLELLSKGVNIKYLIKLIEKPKKLPSVDKNRIINMQRQQLPRKLKNLELLKLISLKNI